MSRLDSLFVPMLQSAYLERVGLEPNEARELIELAVAQDRVIRHLASYLDARAKETLRAREISRGSEERIPDLRSPARMSDERFAVIQRNAESTVHGPMIDELLVECARLRSVRVTHRHTDACLRYAARTGKPHCIADCADTRGGL